MNGATHSPLEEKTRPPACTCCVPTGVSLPGSFFTARWAHVVVAKALIKASVDPNTRDFRGMTALHIAAQAGQVDIVRILLLAGAQCNSCDARGRNPIHYSAMMGHWETTAILLSAGADANARTGGGYYVLHRAALFGRLEVVRVLLVAGADPNARDMKDATPLYAATQNGHSEVIIELLKWGAEIQAKTEQGFTPLHVAARRGHLSALCILLDAGDVQSPLYTPLNATSPLHVAAGFSRPLCVEELLRRGADPTAPDHRGASAVDMAGSLVGYRLAVEGGLCPGAGVGPEAGVGAGEVVSAGGGARSKLEEDIGRTQQVLRRAAAWGRRGWVVMLWARRGVRGGRGGGDAGGRATEAGVGAGGRGGDRELVGAEEVGREVSWAWWCWSDVGRWGGGVGSSGGTRGAGGGKASMGDADRAKVKRRKLRGPSENVGGRETVSHTGRRLGSSAPSGAWGPVGRRSSRWCSARPGRKGQAGDTAVTVTAGVAGVDRELRSVVDRLCSLPERGLFVDVMGFV